MCEPARLAAFYKAMLEHCLGVTAHVVEDDRALMFTYDDIVYILRNTAPANPGLLDVALYIPNDEHPSIKGDACRQVALSVPCLKAWVDSDGDIVLNVQSLTGPIGMMPPIGVVKDLLPQALHILQHAGAHVHESIVLAGIAGASADATDATSEPARQAQHRPPYGL